MRMSLALFANGYLAVVAEEGASIKEYMLSQLQELFEDMEVCRWKMIREYHAAWLQLLEQGQAAWCDESKRAQLRRLMVWSNPSLSSRLPHPPSTSVTSANPQPPTQGKLGRFGYVSVPSKPCNRACSGYNRGICSSNTSHPSDLHVYMYCLKVAQKLCKHPESKCRCKSEGERGELGGGCLNQSASPPNTKIDMNLKSGMDIPHTAAIVPPPQPRPAVLQPKPPASGCSSHPPVTRPLVPS